VIYCLSIIDVTPKEGEPGWVFNPPARLFILPVLAHSVAAPAFVTYIAASPGKNPLPANQKNCWLVSAKAFNKLNCSSCGWVSFELHPG